MITRVRIEKWDANLEEVTVREWLKAEGEGTAVGEPLVEIITDKMTFELEAPGEGVVRRILAPAGSVVPVGYIIAVLADPEEALPEIEAENRALRERQVLRAAALRQTAEATAQQALAGRAAPEDRRRVRATPAARRLAREHRIDLASIAPADGVRVVEEDVRAWLRGRGEAEA